MTRCVTGQSLSIVSVCGIKGKLGECENCTLHTAHPIMACRMHRQALTLVQRVTDDHSVHAAWLTYRRTAWWPVQVLRGVLYNEKVDVFSLAVVMYELCSYTPTVALVTGEDMVDRMYEYAEKVAGGFRQVCLSTLRSAFSTLFSTRGVWFSSPALYYTVDLLQDTCHSQRS